MKYFFYVVISVGMIFLCLPTLQAQINNSKIPEGISTKTIKSGKYEVHLYIIDRPAFIKYMDRIGRKSHKMKSGSSHYIMLNITDQKKSNVTQAAVKIKLISPDGNLKQSRAFPLLENFGTDFNMLRKGTYQVIIEFKAQGKKYKGKALHKIK